MTNKYLVTNNGEKILIFTSTNTLLYSEIRENRIIEQNTIVDDFDEIFSVCKDNKDKIYLVYKNLVNELCLLHFVSGKFTILKKLEGFKTEERIENLQIYYQNNRTALLVHIRIGNNNYIRYYIIENTQIVYIGVLASFVDMIRNSSFESIQVKSDIVLIFYKDKNLYGYREFSLISYKKSEFKILSIGYGLIENVKAIYFENKVYFLYAQKNNNEIELIFRSKQGNSINTEEVVYIGKEISFLSFALEANSIIADFMDELTIHSMSINPNSEKFLSDKESCNIENQKDIHNIFDLDKRQSKLLVKTNKNMIYFLPDEILALTNSENTESDNESSSKMPRRAIDFGKLNLDLYNQKKESKELDITDMQSKARIMTHSEKMTNDNVELQKLLGENRVKISAMKNKVSELESIIQALRSEKANLENEMILKENNLLISNVENVEKTEE